MIPIYLDIQISDKKKKKTTNILFVARSFPYGYHANFSKCKMSSNHGTLSGIHLAACWLSERRLVYGRNLGTSREVLIFS